MQINKRVSDSGVTLTEVIVVSVIVAILAAVAIPVYSGYLADSQADGAKATCELIAAAVMFNHNRGLDITADDWAGIGISDPNKTDEYWTYTFPGIAGTVKMTSAYEITATGKGGQVKGKVGTYKPLPGDTEKPWTLN